MAGSLELLAELLVDGQPADRSERARRRPAGTPLAVAVPWHELRYGHTQALRSWLAEHCSPPAANRHLAALRGVLREAWRLGLMNGQDLARAVDLANVPGRSLPAGRYVEDGEVRRLVAACLADDTSGGRWDAAVLAALFVGGLRRVEGRCPRRRQLRPHLRRARRDRQRPAPAAHGASRRRPASYGGLA